MGFSEEIYDDEEGIMEVNNLEQTTIKEGDKILIFKENLSIL